MAVSLSLVPLAFGVSFVCCAVKERDESKIWKQTLQLFSTLVGGIFAFVVFVRISHTFLI